MRALICVGVAIIATFCFIAIGLNIGLLRQPCCAESVPPEYWHRQMCIQPRYRHLLQCQDVRP